MHPEPEVRTSHSLIGLCLGDCFGEQFFKPQAQVEGWLNHRTLPPPVWRYTDDTAQAAVLARHLVQNGSVHQDLLAAEFAAEYQRDPRRGYGANAHDILSSIVSGSSWRTESRRAFGGMGSMGNGAAMRVAPLGAYFATDLAVVADEASKSAAVTHANRNAIAGAVAVAVAAAIRARGPFITPDEVFAQLLPLVPGSMTRDGLQKASELGCELDVGDAASLLGNGSRVCAHDTVPFAIWCALRWSDSFETALWSTASGLGDMDTTCAIVGGILAADTSTRLPEPWLPRHEGPPRSLLPVVG